MIYPTTVYSTECVPVNVVFIYSQLHVFLLMVYVAIPNCRCKCSCLWRILLFSTVPHTCSCPWCIQLHVLLSIIYSTILSCMFPVKDIFYYFQIYILMSVRYSTIINSMCLWQWYILYSQLHVFLSMIHSTIVNCMCSCQWYIILFPTVYLPVHDIAHYSQQCVFF